MIDGEGMAPAEAAQKWVDANPDVVTHFSSIQVAQEAPDRVRISGVQGSPAPATAKVCLNLEGGFRNRMSFVLTGLRQAGALGKVKVVAYDAASAEVSALKNGGIQALIAQNPKQEGEVAMEAADKLVKGQTLDKTTLTEIVTTTLRNRTGKLADNVTKNNAMLMRMKKKGKKGCK